MKQDLALLPSLEMLTGGPSALVERVAANWQLGAQLQVSSSERGRRRVYAFAKGTVTYSPFEDRIVEVQPDVPEGEIPVPVSVGAKAAELGLGECTYLNGHTVRVASFERGSVLYDPVTGDVLGGTPAP